MSPRGFAAGFAVALVVGACALVSAPARADFGIAGFDGQVVKQDGSAASQAGSHPYAASTTIAFNAHAAPSGQVPDADVKDVVVDLPPGLVGDPTATPTRCDLSDLVVKACPVDAQVGVVAASTVSGELVSPVYNMIPPPDAPGLFAFVVENTPVLLTPSVRSDADYGLTVAARGISQAIPLLGTTLTFWGVPADPSHDAQRCALLDKAVDPPACDGFTGDDRSVAHSAGVPRTPFLRNPTACTPAGVGLATLLSATSWQQPDVVARASFRSHLPPPDEATQIGPTDCAIVPFDPSIGALPGSTRASAPSGWTFGVRLPQNANPDGLAQADLRTAVVTLPAGVRVSPASADGLGDCSTGQIALHSVADPTCPEASQIGTLSLETPLLDEPLSGAVYLATPHANPFGTLLALYLVAKGPGLIVKLAGKVTLDPGTGQLTATFDDNPQLPFSDLRLTFKDGPRSPLANPAACGAYTTHARFTSWSGSTLAATSSFAVDRSSSGGACAARSFHPDFSAGAKDPIAGASTSFLLSLARGDDDQEFQGLSIRTPRGLLGRIASAKLCGGAAANAGTCGAASRIGSVTVGVGPGPDPFYITSGRVSITGPYKGAPFGLSIVVPAKAGPFDLGDVVVRAAIFVDRRAAALRIVSDPLPRILEGIPLQVRDIRVAIDRPNFMLNPTSCAAQSVSGHLLGATPLTPEAPISAAVEDPFQVFDCGALAFKPKLRFRLKGGTHRNDHPQLIATATPRPGDANIARTQVTLPRSAFLDQSHIKTVCTRVQFAADACPKGSIYGKATATTPLLDQPLSGPVYLRSSSHTLPDLVVALKGPPSQPIEIDLAGRIDSVGGALRNSFEAVPDAPVSRFRLELFGGKRGLVVNSRDLCARRYRATVRMDGHNGKVHDFRPALRADCGHRRNGHSSGGKRHR